MRVKDLSLYFRADVMECLKELPFEELNPPQEQSLKAGLLEGENLVLASPTASGKTLVAELAFLKNFQDGKGKTVYVVPLRALASEKYHSFKEKYSSLGLKVGLSIGDLDSSDPWLKDKDVIIATSEKMDSLMRHKSSWIQDVSLVITDEVHLINDSGRGPTLEVVLTQLKERQVLALSATIENAEELAGWLEAKMVRSDYRPVELHRGIYHKNEIKFEGRKNKKLKGKGRADILLSKDTLKKGKQVLMFVSTRRFAESAARKIGKEISPMLEKEEKKQLEELAGQVENVLQKPTKQCKKVAECIRKGTSFHHAGLISKQRQLIEDNFRSGLIKAIASTPTLAYGVNLPAWRCVIRDSKRYYPSSGSSYIPVLEYQQMSGRAGRPDYDKEGEAILVAKSKSQLKELKEIYLEGEAEPIQSKLSVEPVLRMHVLALVASEVCGSDQDLHDFFEKTLFGFQYGDIGEIKNKVEKIADQLVDFKFLSSDKNKDEFMSADELSGERRLKATRIGKRVSELYLDPLTAHKIIQKLRVASESPEKFYPFGYLQMISGTVEIKPWMRVRDPEFPDYQDLAARLEDRIMGPVPDQWDFNYESFLRSMKMTQMFVDWTNEMGEDKVLEKYGLAPGGLYVKTLNADWLLYSSHELALLLGMKNVLKYLKKMRIRIKHGVKEELLTLIRLKNIGRVRSRILYNAGLRRLSDVKKASQSRLSSLLGPKIAKNLKEQLTGKKEK